MIDFLMNIAQEAPPVQDHACVPWIVVYGMATLGLIFLGAIGKQWKDQRDTDRALQVCLEARIQHGERVNRRLKGAPTNG